MTHAQRAKELTPKATHTTVDGMVSFTATEEGDMIIRVMGTNGDPVATRVIPEIQWTHIRKVAR